MDPLIPRGVRNFPALITTAFCAGKKAEILEKKYSAAALEFVPFASRLGGKSLNLRLN